MEISIIDDNTIEIIGNIKSIEDYNNIKSVSQSLISKGTDTITYDVIDSFSMVSSVIGYFIKMVNMHKVQVRLNVHDERLYSLLDQLNLIQLFHVKKV